VREHPAKTRVSPKAAVIGQPVGAGIGIVRAVDVCFSEFIQPAFSSAR